MLEPSVHAAEVGYRDYTPKQLTNAASNNNNQGESESTTSFPRPLILPGDDLSEDPRYPGQSLRSWLRGGHRNEVTSRRNVIYVVSAPTISEDVKMMAQWTQPDANKGRNKTGKSRAAAPGIEGIEAYLGAFYTGMKIARLLPAFSYMSWDEAGSSKEKSQSIPRYIGLRRKDEVIGIRARPCPDGMFKAQLNMNDILDSAISALPDDAYALLLLVYHDLYEDEEDDFCCGRAYGGSRVAVVSSARYNPIFDGIQGVERVHAWPASHCEMYVNSMVEAFAEPRKKTGKKRKIGSTTKTPKTESFTSSPSHEVAGPIHVAVKAHQSLCASVEDSSSENLSNLWTARVCRTASHELGHCFGMDHCVYYACVMQSTASLAEDVRQPPYLCPVDSAKLLRATGATEAEHYAALVMVCESRSDTHMFAALGAWAKARLEELERRAA